MTPDAERVIGEQMIKLQERRFWGILFCLGLLAVCTPSLVAKDDMMCQGDMTTIASLAQCVQHAFDMGYIDNAGILTSLEADLSAAQAALNRCE